MSLSSVEIERFQRDGVLLLRGFFPKCSVKAWNREALDFFDNPRNGEEWRRALRLHKADDFHLAADPTPMSNPYLSSVYRSLHAKADWTGENELVVRPGDQDAPWLGARAPHLDYPIAVPVTTFANTTFYLNDVRERGGAFMYWPGSHHVAWLHHRRHPEDYLARGPRSQDQTFEILTKTMPREPVEFTAEAGDLLIWHSFILHSASINTLPETRLAVIGRWGVPRFDYTPWNFDADIWSSWEFCPAIERGG